MVSFVVSSVWCMRLGVSVVLVRRMNGALMMIMMMMAGICTDTTNVSHSLTQLLNPHTHHLISRNKQPVPGVCPDAVTSHGYRGGFKVQLMRKDVALAVSAAQAAHARLVLGDAALETYEQASADPRCRDLDARVVYRWLGGVEPGVGEGESEEEGEGKKEEEGME